MTLPMRFTIINQTINLVYRNSSINTRSKAVEDDNMLESVALGDVTANQVYYHKSNDKPCVQKFKYEYDKLSSARRQFVRK